MSFQTAPQVPAAQGAPATPPSTPGTTTSRPTPTPSEIAAYRIAQSANDRATALGNQVQQLTHAVTTLTTTQQQEKVQRDREAQQTALDARLEAGEIDQKAYTREVAQMAAQQVLDSRPQTATPDSAQVTQQQTRTIAKNAILTSVGLTGNEPGLDFASPQRLLQSALTYRQNVAAAQQRQQTPPNATPAQQQGNVPDLMAQLGREQGLVIPHYDGGRAVATNAPITEATVHGIASDKSLSGRQKIAALREVRTALAKGVPAS